jgi:hypothetical protein
MSIKTYKPFPQLGIDSGLGMFRQTRQQLDAAADDPESRAQASTTMAKVLVLHREGGVEWKVVRLDGKSQRPSLGDKLRIADSRYEAAGEVGPGLVGSVEWIDL